MGLYINGIGCISPQVTYDNSAFLAEVRSYATHKLLCVEPDYTRFIDPASVRRLSRIAKFGTAAAMIALKDAGIKTPGAISTGTGYGLLENSEKFLKTMIESDESSVSPTAFIQSTHNSISSAIALTTGCNAHNNTFSQKGFSFESALTDALLISKEPEYDNILVGTYDELSEKTFAIMERLNLFREEPCNNLEILHEKGKGVIAGEGAAYFVLAKKTAERTYGLLADILMLHKPEGIDQVKRRTTAFLSQNDLSVNDIDVALSGLNGDAEHDRLLTQANNDFFSASTIAGFKHLCGEYMTASSFAFYLACQVLKTRHVPHALAIRNNERLPKNVLIYNVYMVMTTR